MTKEFDPENLVQNRKYYIPCAAAEYNPYIFLSFTRSRENKEITTYTFVNSLKQPIIFDKKHLQGITEHHELSKHGGEYYICYNPNKKPSSLVGYWLDALTGLDCHVCIHKNFNDANLHKNSYYSTIKKFRIIVEELLMEESK